MIEFLKYGLSFTTVREQDASFIVALRTDPDLAKHLSKTSADVDTQRAWIDKYVDREKAGTEYYFVIKHNNEPLGLSRLYNFDADSFEIGSWLFKKNIPESFPILGDLAARDYGFDTLGFASCRFEVRKQNKSVVRYHQQFKPDITGEDALNYYFKLTGAKFKIHRDKLLNVLL